MSEIIGIDEDSEELRSLSNVWAALPNNNSIHVNTLDPKAADLIRRTEALSMDLTPDIPHPSDRSLVGRVGSPEASRELAANLDHLRNELIEVEETGVVAFPNVAWEAVKLGLEKERFVNDQINTHVKEAEKIQKNIDLLLDLQAEMTSLNDDASEMSQKMREILERLKDQGIDLWKSEDSSINKEKISQLKSLTSAQSDKLRSNLQIIFTTKIQVLIQIIGAIMETLKDIVRNHNRLLTQVNQMMSGR